MLKQNKNVCIELENIIKPPNVMKSTDNDKLGPNSDKQRGGYQGQPGPALNHVDHMSTGVPENRITSLKTLSYQIKGTSKTQGSRYSLVVIKILEEERHQPTKRKDKVSRGGQGQPVTTYPKTQRPTSIPVETSLGLGRGHKGSQPKRVTEARITSMKTLTYQVKEHGQQDPLHNSNLDQELEYPKL